MLVPGIGPGSCNRRSVFDLVRRGKSACVLSCRDDLVEPDMISPIRFVWWCRTRRFAVRPMELGLRSGPALRSRPQGVSRGIRRHERRRSTRPVRDRLDFSVFIDVPEELGRRLMARWLGQGYDPAEARKKKEANGLVNARLVMSISTELGSRLCDPGRSAPPGRSTLPPAPSTAPEARHARTAEPFGPQSPRANGRSARSGRRLLA